MNLQTKLRYFYSFISKALKLFSGTLPLTITHATADNAEEYTFTGDSSQNGTPTPSSPIDVVSVGDLVTDSSDPNYGKYKIPVVVTNNGVATTTTIYASAPLRKVGTYADVLNSNGTITRNVGATTLNGTETWWATASANRFYPKATSDFAALYRDVTVDNSQKYVMCDKLQSNSWNEISSLSSGWSISMRQDGQYSYIRFLVTDVATVADFQTWLASNNLTIYYPLATATTETITAPTIAMAKGTNIVTVNTTVVPSNASFKVWTE